MCRVWLGRAAVFQVYFTMRMRMLCEMLILVGALLVARAPAVEPTEQHHTLQAVGDGGAPPQGGSATGAAFAQRLMQDPYTACQFNCDFSKLWRHQYEKICWDVSLPCPVMSAWDGLPPSSVSDNCPEVAAKNSADFSPESLFVPSDMHLVVYGHSYLKQLFDTIIAAQTVTSVEFLGCQDLTSVCSGGTQAAAPRCQASYNCHGGDHQRFHLANGATVTGVFNDKSLQHRTTKDAAGTADVAARLGAFLRGGAGAAGRFTHALVMEPHGFDFFNRLPGHALNWDESTCACTTIK